MVEKRFITKNSGVKHRKFVDERPLSIQEMYRRSVLGIPLSVPKPRCERIPINDRFYVDDFDVIDISIKNDMRISEEERTKRLEERKEMKRQHDEFLEWKKQKELEISSHQLAE